MSTAIGPPEQRVLLQNVTWKTYEDLLIANQENSAARLTYDRGLLEIVSPSAEHENLKELVSLLVNVVAAELDIDIEGFGSTTFRRADVERGFEPDACFHIEHARRVRGKARLDLEEDPPPDLVIEVDITSSSTEKLHLRGYRRTRGLASEEGEHPQASRRNLHRTPSELRTTGTDKFGNLSASESKPRSNAARMVTPGEELALGLASACEEQ
jgi:Uma2 family endonuclease